MEHIRKKDSFELECKKCKEKRDRVKVRALRRFGVELHTIAVTQCEILKKEEEVLEALKSWVYSILFL